MHVVNYGQYEKKKKGVAFSIIIWENGVLCQRLLPMPIHMINYIFKCVFEVVVWVRDI